jgi:hypothetical protein
MREEKGGRKKKRENKFEGEWKNREEKIKK